MGFPYTNNLLSNPIDAADLNTWGYQSRPVFHVDAYGAVGNNSTDDYAAINSALTAAAAVTAYGAATVRFGYGRYRVSQELVIPANVVIEGPAAPHWGSTTTGLTGKYGGPTWFVRPMPSGSFTGTAVFRVNDGTHGWQLRNVNIDGANSTGTGGVGVIGIEITGKCAGWKILDCYIRAQGGVGVHTDTTTNGWPHGYRVRGLNIEQCTGGGWRSDNTAAQTWAISDVYEFVAEAGANNNDGFYFAGIANSRLDLASTFNAGYGVAVTGLSGTTHIHLLGTDRNQKQGLYLSCSEAVSGTVTVPHVLTVSGVLSRDGKNDNVTHTNIPALEIAGTSTSVPHVPVIISGLQVHVSKDDAGTGIITPDIGIKVSNATQVTLANSNITASSACVVEDVAGTVTGHARGNVFNLVNQSTGALTRNIAPAVAGAVGITDSGPQVNVKLYGAKGDGSTDDTTAVQNAITAGGGGVVLFPPGTYVLSSTLNVTTNGTTLQGSGSTASILRAASGMTGSVMLQFGNGTATIGDCNVYDLMFDSASTKTGNAAIDINKGFRTRLLRLRTNKQYVSVHVHNSTATWISDSDFRDQASDCITYDSDLNSGYDLYLTNVLADNPTVTNSGVGLNWSGGENLVVQNCDFIHFTEGLQIAPPTGRQCRWGFFVDSEFDTASDNCWKITNTGGGDVVGLTFTNGWAGTATNYGVLIDGSGTGLLQGVRLVGAKIVHNGLAGVRLIAGALDVSLTGCDVIGNSQTTSNTRSGIEVTAGTTHFSVTGCRIGNGWQQGTTQSNGINFDAGSTDYFTIVGNDVQGNVNQGINGFSGVTGTNTRVAHNLGTTVVRDPDFLASANNLSDLASAGVARANLGITDFEPADHGALVWTFDPALAVNSSAVSLGVLQLTKLKVAKAISVTNVVLQVNTAGTSLTTGQNLVGIYQGGTLIASTGDQTTAWGSTGTKTAALTGGPVAIAAGDVYVAILTNGTTAPQFVRGASTSQTNFGLTTANPRFATYGTGQTALPSTLGTLALSSLSYWSALS